MGMLPIVIVWNKSLCAIEVLEGAVAVAGRRVAGMAFRRGVWGRVIIGGAAPQK
jgi:hypothetical protein